MKIILAIDGGGVRGIIPASILSYLEKTIQSKVKNKVRIGTLVDLVAGTSTGSIIGSMMIIPDETKKFPKYKMDEIVQMYFDMGSDVFEKNFWHNVKTLWGILGPMFPASNIEPLMLKEMGHHKLGDLLTACMFTGYDIDKRRSNFYTNNDIDKKYENYYVKDVVRGSTSIPSIFPPAYFKEGVNINTIVDGGIFANNPSLSAFVEISKTQFNGEYSKIEPSDVLVISMGTGDFKNKSYPYKKSKKWGKAQWVMPIVNVLLSSHAEVTAYEMNKLFRDVPENYIRINPPIKIGDTNGLDGSKKNLGNLLKDATNYITSNKTMLNALTQKIIDVNHLIEY